MNVAPIGPDAEPEFQYRDRWPHHRWLFLIALVFAAHLGLIFALGDRKPIVPRQPGPGPELRLTIGSNELLALNDPTLFALPHSKGFASEAWRQISQVGFPPFRWTEPPRWLALPIDQLGSTLLGFVRTSSFVRIEFETMPSPVLAFSEARLELAPVTRSTLRVAGELAQRQFLNPVELPSWPGADLLTNSVVNVFVDTVGNVLSHTLLPPGSGSPEADQRALALAKAARFAPLQQSGTAANPFGRLTRGTLIFEWHTAPLPATNAPPANP